jgi:hypothetical protein
MSGFFASLVALCLLCAPAVFAQEPVTAVCNFDPNTQIAVEYRPVTVDTSKPVLGHEIAYDKVWAPGGKPMTMFLNHSIFIDGKEIAVGAYTLFVIPNQDKWTLIISRSSDTSGKYDENQDLMRVPMQSGELSSPESRFSIYFAHLSTSQCNMRLDLGKARAWVEFQDKK